MEKQRSGKHLPTQFMIPPLLFAESRQKLLEEKLLYCISLVFLGLTPLSQVYFHFYIFLDLSCYFFFPLLFFLRLHLQHMEVPGLGVESELQLPAHATATATPSWSRIGRLRHSFRQGHILDPLIEARDPPASSQTPSGS